MSTSTQSSWRCRPTDAAAPDRHRSRRERRWAGRRVRGAAAIHQFGDGSSDPRDPRASTHACLTSFVGRPWCRPARRLRAAAAGPPRSGPARQPSPGRSAAGRRRHGERALRSDAPAPPRPVPRPPGITGRLREVTHERRWGEVAALAVAKSTLGLRFSCAAPRSIARVCGAIWPVFGARYQRIAREVSDCPRAIRGGNRRAGSGLCRRCHRLLPARREARG